MSAAAGDAASIPAAGAARAADGDTTPLVAPGGLRVAPTVRDDEGGPVDEHEDEGPPQPVQPRPASAPPTGAPLAAAGSGQVPVESGIGDQAGNRPGGGDGGGRAPTSQGEEKSKDSNDWGMPEPGDLAV